jgi:hypothetical protein
LSDSYIWFREEESTAEIGALRYFAPSHTKAFVLEHFYSTDTFQTKMNTNATQDSRQSTRIYSKSYRFKGILLLLLCVVLVLFFVVCCWSSKSPARLGESFHVHSLNEGSYATSTQARLRGLQEGNNTEQKEEAKRPWVYSDYATVVPDPQQQSDESAQQSLAEEWGRWSFWDGEENIRPVGSQYADYAYRDVPSDDFDNNAWTVDAVFVNHILDAGTKRLGLHDFFFDACRLVLILFYLQAKNWFKGHRMQFLRSMDTVVI